MKTYCEHCIFAKKYNGKQHGCKLDRLTKYKEMGLLEEGENGNYIVNTLCNTCRNIYWRQYDPVTNCLVQKVLKEEEITYDVIINIDDLDLKTINRLITSYIPSLDIAPKNIVLSGELSESNIDKTKNIKGVIITLDISKDRFSQIQKYIKQCHSSYLLLLSDTTEPAPLTKFNEQLNYHLQPYMYYNGSDYFFIATYLLNRCIYEPNPIEFIQRSYDIYGKPASKHTDMQS